MARIDSLNINNSHAIGNPEKIAHHIKTLHIENFRAIGELDYHPHQINIITGQNNTGKSALLDAIYINATGGGNEPSIHSPSEIYNIKFQQKKALINSDINNLTIYRCLEDCRKADPESYAKVHSNIIEQLSDTFRSEDEDEDEDSTEQYLTIIFDNVDFCITVSDSGFSVFPYYPKGKDILYKELDKIDGIPIINTKSSKKLSMTFFRSLRLFRLFPPRWVNYTLPVFMKSVESVNKLSHSEKFQLDEIGDKEIHLLEQFIKENNLVKNIERLTQKNVLYRKNGEIEEIPISAHGDGFIVLLTTLHSLLQSENGILIIEEPENHLHPRYLGVLIETLFTYCDKLNVQVFMATHSYDLIQGALEFPETEAEKEMLLISKMTSDGETIEKFDYTTDAGLKVINELYLDLRGI